MNNFQKRACLAKLAQSLNAVRYVRRARALYKQAGEKILPGRPMPAPGESTPGYRRSILEEEDPADSKPVPVPPGFGDYERRPSPRPTSYMDDDRSLPRYMGDPNSNIIVPMEERYVPIPTPPNYRRPIQPFNPEAIPRPVPYNYNGGPLGPHPALQHMSPVDPNAQTIGNYRKIMAPIPNPGPRVRPQPDDIPMPRPMPYK